MGSTVFMGAITTATAGAIMFVCFMFFFFKMALLICITIFYSFLFSLGFFMSVVWVIGPEGNFGDFNIPFMPWLNRVRDHSSISKKLSQQEAPEEVPETTGNKVEDEDVETAET